MKSPRRLPLLLLIAGGLVQAATPPPREPGSGITIEASLPEVPVAIYRASFASGDEIVIQSVVASSPVWKGGETLTVRGRFRLASQPSATLALYVTTRERAWTKSSPRQTTRVRAGTGEFELTCEIPPGGGEPHVSFYPSAGGSVMGGVYFRPSPSR
jgi:hypothetical protein